jgi:DNA-binding MarR family transcriptional regulator
MIGGKEMNTFPTGTDSKTARRLLMFIEEFRKISPFINAGQIAIFLHIAAVPGNQGISMKDIERRTGISSSAVSRNVLALSETEKVGKPGHNLVETFDDLQDRRNKLVRLKPKGVRVYNTLIELLGR